MVEPPAALLGFAPAKLRSATRYHSVPTVMIPLAVSAAPDGFEQAQTHGDAARGSWDFTLAENPSRKHTTFY
jgi:hypothetical protein